MNYRFIPDDQYYRVIPACMVDARAGTPLANQIGTVIKSYTDAEVEKASQPGILPYKIEALSNGGLVGYVTLKLNNGVASVYQQVVRPNFKQFIATINQEIIIFIQSLSWVYD